MEVEGRDKAMKGDISTSLVYPSLNRAMKKQKLTRLIQRLQIMVILACIAF
jgi:hypothetical protein